MNKKTKLIIIIAAIVVIVVLFVVVLSNSNKDKKLLNYLYNIGFVNYNDSYLYAKQVSDYNLEQYNENVKQGNESKYEMLYFNIKEYQLTKDKMSYNSGITKNITSVFDYATDSLSYDYRINFNDTNIIMEGMLYLDTGEFVCEPTFSYNINIENSKEDICNKVKLEIDNFQYEAVLLIQEPELLEYMRKK